MKHFCLNWICYPPFQTWYSVVGQQQVSECAAQFGWYILKLNHVRMQDGLASTSVISQISRQGFHPRATHKMYLEQPWRSKNDLNRHRYCFNMQHFQRAPVKASYEPTSMRMGMMRGSEQPWPLTSDCYNLISSSLSSSGQKLSFCQDGWASAQCVHNGH